MMRRALLMMLENVIQLLGEIMKVLKITAKVRARVARIETEGLRRTD